MKRILIVIAGVLCLVAGVAAVSILWLRSDGGRAWIAREIADRAGTPGEAEISIGALTGDPFGVFRVADVRVRDRAGEWLTIKSAEIVWRPLDLLQGNLTITDADIRDVALDRLPKADPSVPATGIAEQIAAFRKLPSVRIAVLKVEDLALGAPVLGEKAVLRIAGGIDSAADESVRGLISVKRVDGRAGSLVVTGIYSFGGDMLSLDVSVAEPGGGLLARTFDIPGLPPLRGTAKGAGPLADWKGHAELSFERVAAAQADVTIRHKKETEFEATGTATVPAGKPGLLRRLASGEHRFHIAGGVSADEVLTVSALRWATDTADVTASGRLALDNLAIDGKATLRKTDTTPLALTPTGASLASLTAEITASGRLPVPALQVSFDIGRLDLPDVAVADVSGAATVTPDGTERGRLDGQATLRQMVWAEPSGLTALAGDEIGLQLAADLDAARSSVHVGKMRATAAHAELSGSGDFGWQDGGGTLTAALAVPDLSALRDRAGLPLAGALALSLDATLRDFGVVASATLSGGAKEFSAGNTITDAVLARDVSLAAALSLAENKLEAKQVTVTSGRTSLQADGTYDMARDAAAGTYKIGIGAGPPIALADAVALDCACSLSGQVTGKLSALGATGDLAAQSLRLQDIALRVLTAQYDLANIPDAPSGTLAVKTETPMGALAARTKAGLHGKRLQLSGLHAEGGDAVADGTLEIPLSGDPIAGDLRFDLRDLKALFAAAGLEGEGTAKGQVVLRADGKRQAVDAKAEAAALQFRSAPGAPVFSAEKATVAIAAADLFAGDRNKVDLRIEKAAVGDATFDRVTAAAEGSLVNAQLSVSGKGDWRGPLAVEGAATYAVAKNRQRLTVSKFRGTVIGETLSLGNPLDLAWGGPGFAAESLDIAFGGAKLTGYVRTDPKAGDVSLVLAGLPLAVVDPFWPLGMNGKVGASLAFKGPWPEPEGKFSISVPGLQVDQVPDAPALAVDVMGDWRGGRLAFQGKLSAGDAPPSVFNASLPLRIEGPDLFVTIPRGQPISGNLAWSGETAALWRFVPLPEHRVRGTGKIDVKLSGTVAKPDLQGTLTVTDGYYESLEYGTVLKPLDLAIRFDGQQARIMQLSAGDGSGGKVSGKGNATFDMDAGFPFDLTLTLDALTAVRRDDVQASASGTMSATGSVKKSKIESKLTTDTVEIRILDRLPPEVASLDVVEVGRFGDDRRLEKAERPITADIDLAIDIEMPRRVFVRGRGIDSEWKGNLKVTGPASDPRIAGYIALVRGQMTVVGKTFQMEKGNVVLPDRANEEPQLSLTAAYSGRTLTVRAQVDGPISKPAITLSSVPSLPQDEIVSRVLFDKSSTKLSPFETAQLALALAELAGKGGSGGVMDFARKTLGVDVLQVESIETAKGSQPVVGAGKYVTEDVYVGVKQGATPESSSVGVEVEVTPNIFLESDVRRSGQSDVGVKFKLDY